MQFESINAGLRKFFYIPEITSVLIIFFSPASVRAQSLIPQLEFKAPRLLDGAGTPGEGRDGAVYVFENVGWDMDALVTIQGRSGPEVELLQADLPGPDEKGTAGTGMDEAWQPEIRYGRGAAPAHIDWWMEFRISFVKHGHLEQSLTVNQFYVTGLDIDGDGVRLREYQSYYNMRSFSLDQPSAIFASSIRGSWEDPYLRGKRFNGPVRDYPGISNEKATRVVSFYAETSELVVRLGAETGSKGSEKADREYGLLFKSLAFGIPPVNQLPEYMLAYEPVHR